MSRFALSKRSVSKAVGTATRRRSICVFLSYAHEDSVIAREIEKALSVLISSGEIDLFADWRMVSGVIWKKKLKSFINQSRIAILLLSNDFFSSTFIQDVELPAILDKSSKGKLKIIPVMVRHCAFDLHRQLGHMQLFNTPEAPLASLRSSRAEAELTRLARQIGKQPKEKDESRSSKRGRSPAKSAIKGL